ncbi:MAG: tRNA pseudouridine(38-40) synthase TruA [Halobacteriales archaeon]
MTAKRGFRIAYDGRSYRGFQRQPDVETVEGALFDALRELDLIEGTAAPAGYAAAGRTDAGVSAVAQTIGFEAPEWCTPQALNGPLPDAIRVWGSAAVDQEYHATHDAVHREYTYFLPAPEADPERAASVANRLSGEHDFHNLTPDTDGTVRDLAVDVRCEGPFLVLTVGSDGFPRQLVRRVAALLGAIATRERSPVAVDRILGPEPIVGAAGIGPAPAEGLVLTGVTYPVVSFEIDATALPEAREVFQSRRWAARREGRALGRVVDGLVPK